MGIPAPSYPNLPPSNSADSNVTEAFGAQRRVEPKGPLVSLAWVPWGECPAVALGRQRGLGSKG